MRALQHWQKYQSSLFGLWLIRAPREQSVPVDGEESSLLLSLPSSPYLTSPHTALPPHFSSSSHQSGMPLSDRCQMTTNTKRQSRHQHCMSATSMPTNFARFHLLAVSSCANLPTSCAIRVSHGPPRVQGQLACPPCAPSTPLFFSLAGKSSPPVHSECGEVSACALHPAAVMLIFNFVFLLCL